MKARKLILAIAVATITAPAATAGTDAGLGIPAGRDAVSPTAPLVSEKTAGLFPAPQLSSPLVSEKTSGLWRTSAPVSTAPVFAAPEGGFDWSDAGIGAGISLVSVLAASAGAVAIRRRGLLAH
jgi:hypothetical protein